MKWQEVRSIFPDRWVIMEALESHLIETEVNLDEIAVLATTTNGHEMMRLYGQWRNKLRDQDRLVLFAHTSQDIPSIKDDLVPYLQPDTIFHVKKKLRWKFSGPRPKGQQKEFGNP